MQFLPAHKNQSKQNSRQFKKRKCHIFIEAKRWRRGVGKRSNMILRLCAKWKSCIESVARWNRRGDDAAPRSILARIIRLHNHQEPSCVALMVDCTELLRLHVKKGVMSTNKTGIETMILCRNPSTHYDDNQENDIVLKDELVDNKSDGSPVCQDLDGDSKVKNNAYGSKEGLYLCRKKMMHHYNYNTRNHCGKCSRRGTR